MNKLESLLKPTDAVPGYYWRMMADGRGEPSVVRVVEWGSGYLDGPDKPWRMSYLAECFGSMCTSWSLEDLESRGEVLVRIQPPDAEFEQTSDKSSSDEGLVDWGEWKVRAKVKVVSKDCIRQQVDLSDGLVAVRFGKKINAEAVGMNDKASPAQGIVENGGSV